MKGTTLGLMLVLMVGISLPCIGGIKYRNLDGRVRFTDAPLRDSNFRPEWRCTSKKLVMVSGNPERLAPPKNLSAKRKQYAKLIKRTARRFKLHPALLHAVIRAESGYDSRAVSPAGAIGLMQLIPTTAAKYKVTDLKDPTENLRAGAQHLRFLLDKFGQNLRLALAGYNAGENAVVRHGNQIPPYPETQQYVRKVLRYLWTEMRL